MSRADIRKTSHHAAVIIMTIILITSTSAIFVLITPSNGEEDFEEWLMLTTKNSIRAAEIELNSLTVGTTGGVSRYAIDEMEHTLTGGGLRESATASYTIQNGLGDNHVRSLMTDSQGNTWYGTWGGGMSRFDGTDRRTFTWDDGLSNNRVGAILEDPDGVMWFGTWGGGVSSYDGTN